MRTLKTSLSTTFLTAILTTPALAQEASFAVTLGRDTLAIERFTRSGKTITGEVASHFGAPGNRIS